MISVEQYWMGHDRGYAADLTPEVAGNAHILIERVNVVLARAAADRVFPAADGLAGSAVASGWRPRAVNDASANASKISKHIIGCAIDLRDRVPGRPLARWLLRNRQALEEAGLWMKDPQWTPDWVHLQSVPPATGDRVFVPSASPALAEKLGGLGTGAENLRHWLSGFDPESFVLLNYGDISSRMDREQIKNEDSVSELRSVLALAREGSDGDAEKVLAVLLSKWDSINRSLEPGEEKRPSTLQ